MDFGYPVAFYYLSHEINTFAQGISYRMKKILSIVFIGLFLLNSCGYYFIFSYNQGTLRDEMRNLIHAGYFRDHYEQLLITNPSSDPDFKWAEKGEFRYHGKLYDLVSEEVRGNSIILNCINDKKEEELVSRHDQFQHLLSGINSPERTKNTRALQSLVIKQALLRNFSFQPPTPSLLVIFYDPIQDMKSITISPTYPPPRFS